MHVGMLSHCDDRAHITCRAEFIDRREQNMLAQMGAARTTAWLVLKPQVCITLELGSRGPRTHLTWDTLRLMVLGLNRYCLVTVVLRVIYRLATVYRALAHPCLGQGGKVVCPSRVYFIRLPGKGVLLNESIESPPSNST